MSKDSLIKSLRAYADILEAAAGVVIYEEQIIEESPVRLPFLEADRYFRIRPEPTMLTINISTSYRPGMVTQVSEAL